MKKKYIIISFIIFFALFFSSPYVLDYFQLNSALKAVGGMSCTEGIVKPATIQCTVSCEGACCTGGPVCSFAKPPACIEQDLKVTTSAGGRSCGKDYLLSEEQIPYAQGAQNLIIGGTTMLKLSVVASENGCIGCTAAINSPKVYAFKNGVKSFIDDYIITIFKD